MSCKTSSGPAACRRHGSSSIAPGSLGHRVGRGEDACHGGEQPEPAQYGGLKADDAKRLKELAAENARLKRIVADKELQIEALKELGRETGGQHRSTQRHQSRKPDRDRALRDQLRQLSRTHPRWGYRRAHAVLREQGWTVNRKAIQRRWREEGLWVPARRRKRQRLGTSSCPADRLAAEHPNHVWALDYQFDQTTDGRILKLLNVVDEHTREALTITVDRRIDADATVAVLDRLVTERSRPPRFIRHDNGPELTANALRDWCRFTGSGTSYIEPGSPWQNPLCRIPRRAPAG
jgi:putative transposase